LYRGSFLVRHPQPVAGDPIVLDHQAVAEQGWKAQLAQQWVGEFDKSV